LNTDELKKLLKGSTAVLILDNGEPSFVVLGYDSYKNLISDQEKEIKINHPVQVGVSPSINNGQPLNLSADDPGIQKPIFPASSPVDVSGKFQYRISEKEAELLEKINREILALKNEIDKEEKSTVVDG